MDEQIDYKEMYLKMVRATEAAINILIEAQQECEELYMAPAASPETAKNNQPQAQN